MKQKRKAWPPVEPGGKNMLLSSVLVLEELINE